jgi:hypothetical protein
LALSIAAMKREIEVLMRSSFMNFDWRLRGELGGAAADNLIVVRVKGSTAGDVQPRA